MPTSGRMERAMEIRVVSGAVPSELEAAVEASKRQLGPISANEFLYGAMREGRGSWVPPASPKFFRVREAGATWAREEIARRARTASA